METAKENGLNLMEYINYLFEEMPNIDFKENPEELEKLSPWNKVPERCC